MLTVFQDLVWFKTSQNLLTWNHTEFDSHFHPYWCFAISAEIGRAALGSFGDSSSRGRRFPGSSGEQAAVADRELLQLILVAGSLSLSLPPCRVGHILVFQGFFPPPPHSGASPPAPQHWVRGGLHPVKGSSWSSVSPMSAPWQKWTDSA